MNSYQVVYVSNSIRKKEYVQEEVCYVFYELSLYFPVFSTVSVFSDSMDNRFCVLLAHIIVCAL